MACVDRSEAPKNAMASVQALSNVAPVREFFFSRGYINRATIELVAIFPYNISFFMSFF